MQSRRTLDEYYKRDSKKSASDTIVKLRNTMAERLLDVLLQLLILLPDREMGVAFRAFLPYWQVFHPVQVEALLFLFPSLHDRGKAARTKNSKRPRVSTATRLNSIEKRTSLDIFTTGNWREGAARFKEHLQATGGQLRSAKKAYAFILLKEALITAPPGASERPDQCRTQISPTNQQ